MHTFIPRRDEERRGDKRTGQKRREEERRGVVSYYWPTIPPDELRGQVEQVSGAPPLCNNRRPDGKMQQEGGVSNCVSLIIDCLSIYIVRDSSLILLAHTCACNVLYLTFDLHFYDTCIHIYTRLTILDAINLIVVFVTDVLFIRFLRKKNHVI